MPAEPSARAAPPATSGRYAPPPPMLPPPPVLAPPVGTAVTAALDDTCGAGAVGATEVVLGTGTGGAVVGGAVVGGVVGGGVVGGGVDLHVQVGDGFGV